MPRADGLIRRGWKELIPMNVSSPVPPGSAPGDVQSLRGLAVSRGCVVAYRRCPVCGSRLYVSPVPPVHGCDGGCSESAIVRALTTGVPS